MVKRELHESWENRDIRVLVESCCSGLIALLQYQVHQKNVRKLYVYRHYRDKFR